MALIRPLVGLVLVSALAAGCSQSLFDFPGDNDGNGTPDGGPGSDGGDVSPDANLGPPPDAAVPADCPEPCLFDAVRNFVYSDSGASDYWLYEEEQPGPFGTSHSVMHLETREDGTMAYVGSGLGAPAIVHCPSYPGYPNCIGVEDKILFETTSPEGTYPALAWVAPQDARRHYRLSGDWRIPATAQEGAPMTLLLVRNSRFDTVLEARFLTSTEPGAFDFEMDVQPGDALRLIAIPGDSSSVPVALSFYISEPAGSERCQMTTFFENGPPSGELEFPNLCAPIIPPAPQLSFTDQFDTGQACSEPQCPATTEDAPPTGIRGKARAFVEGASMQYQGAPNDYSGDWTVQFWAYLDNEGFFSDETLLADHDCGTERGVRVIRDSFDDGTSELRVHAYYPDPDLDRCQTGPQVSLTTSVTNDQWHFIRITRSTASETVSLCIDGVYAGHTSSVPGNADFSASEPMWLGRAVTYEPAAFYGKLADLRVFGAALPCVIP